MADPAVFPAPVSYSKFPRQAALRARVARLSGTADLPTQAARLAQGGPPIDYARLAAIRHAIFNGTYLIDPAAIAEAMIQQHSPFMGGSKS